MSDHNAIRPGLPGLIPRPARERDKRVADSSAAARSRKSPPRAALNAIPSPERLQSLIENALSALRQGIFWDRGAIVNILL